MEIEMTTFKVHSRPRFWPRKQKPLQPVQINVDCTINTMQMLAYDKDMFDHYVWSKVLAFRKLGRAAIDANNKRDAFYYKMCVNFLFQQSSHYPKWSEQARQRQRQRQ
jgi:hypothetical protein